ncbi:MAG: TM2 domain-containing protein [Anaerorhabdus sp.]
MKKEDYITSYLIKYSDYFPRENIREVQEKLENLESAELVKLLELKLHNPTSILVVSAVAGSLGIDRFMIGDVVMGLLKLCTLGLCGILSIIDLFFIHGKTKENNYKRLCDFLR